MTRTIKTITLAAAAATALTLAGCNTCQTCADANAEEALSAAPINTVCPVGGHPVADGGPTATFEGKTVGFCCQSCADTWAESTDDERREYLAEAMKGEMQG